MPLKYKLINYHRLDVGNICADNNETGANYLVLPKTKIYIYILKSPTE